MLASAAEKKARAARFAKRTPEVPLPKVRKAFPDAGPNGKWVSNSNEALAKLIARKLERGEQLTEAQVAAATAAGINTSARAVLAPATNTAGRVVGEFVLSCPDAAAQNKQPRQRKPQQAATSKNKNKQKAPLTWQEAERGLQQDAKSKTRKKKKAPLTWQEAERDLPTGSTEAAPAATGVAAVPTAAAAATAAETSHTVAGNVSNSGAIQKRLKKSRKLLRQIEQLEQSAAAGQQLQPAQRDKILRGSAVRAEIAAMLQQLESCDQ